MDHSNEPQSQAVAAAAQRFAHEGRWFPPKASRHARAENWREYDHDLTALAEVAKRYPRERTQGEGFTLDEVRAAISTAYDLAGNERLTAVRYQNIAAEHRLPSIKTVIAAAKRNGTSFSELVGNESARRLRNRKTA